MQGLQRCFVSAEACRRGIAAGLDLLLLGNNLLDESAQAADFAAGLAAAARQHPALGTLAAAALARVRARKRQFGRA
jgi:beta-N-acetylhexosaminidase